ncbi:transmembrane 220 family protein [Flaviaesturariibacter amylovorans]|uniref:Transmembrane family 220, helix n=1 Tax=Flaviaesturariibacter amylovorans TaxID=1084520 RepID=A0ABP8HSC5_9BACT
MKAINLLFMVLFVVSAALQYNDPDPYLWMPIYLLGAFLCWEAARGRFRGPLYALAIGGYSLYMVVLLLRADGVLSWARDHDRESLVQSMKATKPWVENTREFGGLALLLLILLLNWFYWRPRAHRVSRGTAGATRL